MTASKTREPKLVRGVNLVRAIVTQLRRLGFEQTGVNEEKTSYYLRFPRVQFRLRISDHPWSPSLRSRHIEVIYSVVPSPVIMADVPEICAKIAAEYFDRVRRRRLGAAA